VIHTIDISADGGIVRLVIHCANDKQHDYTNSSRSACWLRVCDKRLGLARNRPDNKFSVAVCSVANDQLIIVSVSVSLMFLRSLSIVHLSEVDMLDG